MDADFLGVHPPGLCRRGASLRCHENLMIGVRQSADASFISDTFDRNQG
jgi:hypothetical protein